jgi:hypothetical protein
MLRIFHGENLKNATAETAEHAEELKPKDSAISAVAVNDLWPRRIADACRGDY